MTEAERAEVVVVGAGASALSLAGALRNVGRRAVLLERDARVGATWVRRYDRLHLHTARRFSGLAHYAIPRTRPRYLSKDEFARYLEEYAERLALDVRLGVDVHRVRPLADGWRAEAHGGRSWESRVVVLATGRHAEKFVPSWPGADTFGGRIVHSADYRSATDFVAERVLVVGAGNSGAEIAADLAENGERFVAIAVRRVPPIVPREMLGVPVQVVGIVLSPLPPRVVDSAGALVRRVGNRDLRAYGLRDAEWSPFAARRPATIDVGFLRQLRAGRIAARPDVRRLTAGTVAFVDGREEEYDAIVAATGFRSSLKRLVDLPGLEEGYRPGEPTQYPGLFLMGFVETVRGQLFEANRESRRLARTIDRTLERPRASAVRLAS